MATPTLPAEGTSKEVFWNNSQLLGALPAGTAVIGKVGIDQTTPGTTNAVDTELPAAAALADGAANPTVPTVGTCASLFNGTTFDRERGNADATVFASAARTATPTPFDGTNYNGRGLHLVIDCTAITSSPSVVFTVQGKDALSGKFYTLLVSAAIVGTGTTVLKVFPGATAAANAAANDILPRSWRVIATHGNADSITYSVGASVIL